MYVTKCNTSLLHTQQIKLDRVATVTQCTILAAIRLAECESRSCRKNSRAVSATDRQELQRIFKNVFTKVSSTSDRWRTSFTTIILTCGALCYTKKLKGWWWQGDWVRFSVELSLSLSLSLSLYIYIYIYTHIKYIYILFVKKKKTETLQKALHIKHKEQQMITRSCSVPASIREWKF